MPSLTPLGVPHWSQSIRFRLALTYAVTVYLAGSVLIGGMYTWQARQLENSELVSHFFVYEDRQTGERVAVSALLTTRPGLEVMEGVERSAYVRALGNLRKATIIGLMILAVVAFVIGWALAHIALRPVNRMTAVARDITGSDLSRRISLHGPNDELKGLADTFDSMLDRLQAAFEDQRRFVQDASHELRNPLAVARTNLELALSDRDASADDLRASAEVAHRSTERMAVLIDDLLNQARTGVPAVELCRLDLATVVEDVAGEYRSVAKASSVSIQVEAPEPLTIHGDTTALTRAVANLISNAIRYAPADTAVSISVLGDDHHATVSVSDEGPGLAPDEKKQVFDRFWRADRSGPGTGLGLSIVQQIVRRHGGRAEVESAPGEGSTFRLVLPLATGSGTGKGTVTAADRGPAGGDDPDARAVNQREGTRRRHKPVDTVDVQPRSRP